MRGSGDVVPAAIRRLARTIMRHAMGRHRRPDLSRLSMRLDQRAACLSTPAKADQQGRVGWWVRLATLERGRPISVPLLAYDHHRRRAQAGKVSNGVMVCEDRDPGRLMVGVVTDTSAACAAGRAAYRPEREALALDFGLSTLFATDEGDLLGRDWLKALRAYDRRITEIARGQQRRGRKPRDSARYRGAVAALRGFLRTEVGRVLSRLVAAKRPAALVLERLDFRNPALSRRLNAIVQNCGRSVIRATLADLHDRFGVVAKEINPAYTSQVCSACGCVDKNNRPSQARFRCLWCGHALHADRNAARNVGQRRALAIGSVLQRKDAVLGEVVRAFSERRVRSLRSGRPGARDCPADPRDANPYFGGVRPVAARMSRKAKPPPDLVAV